MTAPLDHWPAEAASALPEASEIGPLVALTRRAVLPFAPSPRRSSAPSTPVEFLSPSAPTGSGELLTFPPPPAPPSPTERAARLSRLAFGLVEPMAAFVLADGKGAGAGARVSAVAWLAAELLDVEADPTTIAKVRAALVDGRPFEADARRGDAAAVEPLADELSPMTPEEVRAGMMETARVYMRTTDAGRRSLSGLARRLDEAP